MPVGCRIRFSWPLNRRWRCRRIPGPSRNDIPVSLVNLSHKAIPATRNRHDVAVRTWRFAKDLPQFRYCLARLFSSTIESGQTASIIRSLSRTAIVVLDHVEECFEHSRCERNRCSIQPAQEPFPCVDLKLPKFVKCERRPSASRVSEKFRKIQRQSKDFHKGAQHLPSCANAFRTSPQDKETKTDTNNRIKTHATTRK